MECGLPIVTTPVFGIAEQVVPGANALCYTPGDHRAPECEPDCADPRPGTRDDMARQSSWVLRRLLSHDEMIDQYERLFLAAAQSRPLADPNEARAFQRGLSPTVLLSHVDHASFKTELSATGLGDSPDMRLVPIEVRALDRATATLHAGADQLDDPVVAVVTHP